MITQEEIDPGKAVQDAGRDPGKARHPELIDSLLQQDFSAAVVTSGGGDQAKVVEA
jgi:hypothetical protein